MNKGELLIESLITLLFISLAFIPISKSISNANNITRKIEIEYAHISNLKNLMEDFKSMEYEKISSKEGERNFKNIMEVCSYYGIDPSNYEKINKKINIKIKKTKEYFQLYRLEYIYELKVGDYNDYYIP